MAISEDTAALVAAQLAAAWAAKTGTINGHAAADEQILGAYLRFRDLVRERDISHGKRPAD